MTKRVVRLTASWCGPCQSMGKVMEAVTARHPEHTYEVVDTDTDPTLQIKHRTGLPALLVYGTDGELYRALSGLKTGPEIIDVINSAP